MSTASLSSRRPISGLVSLWDSTIGKKYVMALTGLIWFGYLIAHLWGNLKIYAGSAGFCAWLASRSSARHKFSGLPASC